MTETTENTVNLPYRNPELPTEERIADLLGRMTLEEKVGQMMQLDARSGDLDDLIVNKHVGSILHTSPSDLPKAVETVNAKTVRSPRRIRRPISRRLIATYCWAALRPP